MRGAAPPSGRIHTLHTKLMLSLVLLVTLVAGVSTLLLLQHAQNRRFAELNERANRIADLYSQSLAQPLWNVDREAITRQLKALAPNPEVVRFTVTATGYGVLADVSNAPQPSNGNSVVQTRSIEFAPQGDAPLERIGEVRVVLTKAVTEQNFAAARTVAFATLALILAVVYIVTFLLVRRLVREPIRRLEEMVDRIAGGDLDARCMVESSDELGRLAARVNIMAEHLSESTASLRESERKYRGIIQSSLEGIFILDQHGRLHEANPAMARLLGFDNVASLLALNTDRLPIPNVRALPFPDEEVAKLFALLNADGEVAGHETEVRRADGTTAWCLLNARGIRHDNDGPVLLNGQMTDVTDRKHAMESLTRHRDELEQQIRERMRTELELRESREKLRLLSAHQESIREEERKQMAMTIHDELGQLLTAIKMDLSLLRLLLSQGVPWNRKLGEMGELIDRTMSIVRNVANHLRPAALNFGLVSALEWLVLDYSRHSALTCRFRLEGPEPTLNDDHATAVFRIVQEALTNVGRHARATQVDITLHGDIGGFEVTISDDGAGFDVAGARNEVTYGLQGMHERARMIGAQLQITSSRNVGSTVRLKTRKTA